MSKHEPDEGQHIAFSTLAEPNKVRSGYYSTWKLVLTIQKLDTLTDVAKAIMNRQVVLMSRILCWTDFNNESEVGLWPRDLQVVWFRPWDTDNEMLGIYHGGRREFWTDTKTMDRINQGVCYVVSPIPKGANVFKHKAIESWRPWTTRGHHHSMVLFDVDDISNWDKNRGK